MKVFTFSYSFSAPPPDLLLATGPCDGVDACPLTDPDLGPSRSAAGDLLAPLVGRGEWGGSEVPGSPESEGAVLALPDSSFIEMLGSM